jgi:hypothetical protein
MLYGFQFGCTNLCRLVSDCGFAVIRWSSQNLQGFGASHCVAWSYPPRIVALWLFRDQVGVLFGASIPIIWLHPTFFQEWSYLPVILSKLFDTKLTAQWPLLQWSLSPLHHAHDAALLYCAHAAWRWGCKSTYYFAPCWYCFSSPCNSVTFKVGSSIISIITLSLQAQHFTCRPGKNHFSKMQNMWMKGNGVATLVQNKIFPRKTETAAVRDHGITTRRADAAEPSRCRRTRRG